MSDTINVCYVYCYSIESESARFSPLPIRRMGKICMGSRINIHAAYAGTLKEELLTAVGVNVHHFEMPDRDIPRLIRLYRLVKELEQEQEIDVFMNVWAHHDVFPLVFGRDKAAVVPRVVGDPIGNANRVSHIDDLKYHAKRKREWLALSMSDHLYFNSHTIERAFRQRGFSDTESTTISQGVDVETFAPTDQEREPLIIFAGRLDSKKKGIEETIEAFNRASSMVRNRNPKLVLAGRGTPPAPIQSKIDENPDISVAGLLSQDELAMYYNRATALVLLSDQEALPNVVLEAFSTKLPVIATPVGDVPEIIEASGGGVTVSQSDIKTTAKHLTYLLENPTYADYLGANGRAYVEENHSFDAVQSEYLDLFDAVVDNRR